MNYTSTRIIDHSLKAYKVYLKGYRMNKKPKTLFNRILLHFLKRRKNHYNLLLNCYVPFSAKIGKGLVLPHGFHGIFISKNAEIGKNCTILHQVTIGSTFKKQEENAPIIGNNVFIGAGAKIIGNVKVGDNAKIGVNAVVISDVEAGETVIAPKAIIL